jgi:outer membrane protein OmpA-like peptidoglycan-associated protein
MWLWIWLLLFFIIFCVWNKLQALKSDVEAPTTQAITETVSVPKVIAPEPSKAIRKVEEIKDINLKILKEDNIVKISGLFTSKEDLEKLKSSYLKTFDKVEEDYIIFDENAKNEKVLEMVSNLGGDFSKFKNGYLEYGANKFTIDGIVDDEEVKNSIGEKAQIIENLTVDNKISISQPEKVEVKEESKGPSIEEIQKKLNDLLKVKNVEFVFSKAKLTSNGKKTVDEVFTVLDKYKNIKVEVGGHTDSVGSKKSNKALSQKRADSIKRYLDSKGIDSKRLTAIGYGESKPLVKNNNAKNRQINRRVEFKIIGE